jgi:hypothetical protein
MKILPLVILLLGLGAFVSVPAGSAQERWRVIARGTDTEGGGVAVVAAAKRRMSGSFAVRVRVSGEPKTAKVHAVVTCSRAGPGGHVVSSRRQEFAVTAPAMRVLRLPMPYPEECGVTAMGIASSLLHRVGNASAHITVEILARCTVQRNGACL